MSRPTAISPEEQEQIARRIGVLLLQEAPEDWQQVTVEYRATGEYHDLLAEVTLQDGDSRAWEPPEELNGIFEHLREGMYRPDVGTWLSALYTVERPSSYRIDINFDEEPQWQQPLPPEAYAEELRRYPRSEDNVPEWMSARLGATQAEALPVREPRKPEADLPAQPEPHAGVPASEEAAVPRLTTARVFDDADEWGRPLVQGRPPLSPQESEPLRRYLESAPVVLPAENYGPDLLNPSLTESVPDSWHSDGAWVWPGAVAYYLAQYGMPPQPELVQHIRSASFTVTELEPAVHEAAERAARSVETGTEAGAEADAPHAADVPDTPEGLSFGDGDALGTDEAVTTTMETTSEQPLPHFAERPDEDAPGHAEELFREEPLSEKPARSYDPLTDPPEEAPFTVEDPLEQGPSDEDAVEPSDSPDEPHSFAETVAASRHGRSDEPEEEAETIFAQLRERFDELGVPPAEYSLGLRSEAVRSLFDEEDDWVVTTPDDDEVMRFVRPDQACAYLLGSLLLDGSEEVGGVPPTSESDIGAAPVVQEDGPALPREEPLEAPAVPTEAREEAPAGDAVQPEVPPTEPAPAELPKRHDPTEAAPANAAGENFLFAATETRDEEPEAPAVPTPSPGTAEDDPGTPSGSPDREPASLDGREPAPAEPTPLPERTPEHEADSAGTPPPGQMPPPLPKRPPRSEQPEASDQPGPGQPTPDQSGQQPPVAPPNVASGSDGQQPPGTPPAARPAGAAPPPPPRPPHPNATGAPGQAQPGPGVPGPAPGQAQPPQNGQPPAGQPPAGQPPVGQPSAGAPAPQPPHPGGEQPIQPLQGEPPLTLYRSRQSMMLQPGAEVDRFGDPEGNVMYAIRTPYNQRSLPPQWASRNYFAYRVQRPVQVLCGTAVPWFEQPGGGTAYVLPASVNELLADGTLVALNGNEAMRPPMEG